MQMTTTVSWDTYAQKYDMLLSYNPFYQQLNRQVLALTREWEIASGDRIADVGAGTGNYSLALAQLFPQAEVLHIDNDAGMNSRTWEKRQAAGLRNHRILSEGIDTVQLPAGSLKALVSIHALYTFPDPEQALRKMYQWLEPGGQAILVDAGRIVKVLSWQLAIGRHLLRHCGLRKTLQILREGREVSRQNAYIRNMQRKGIFWTHGHREFCETIESVGFEIRESNITFRGVSDLVVVRKPVGKA